MKTNIFKQILDRLQSESPKFFIILRWIFGVLAVIAAIFKWILLRELWVPDPKVIAAIQEVCGYIFTAASTMWFSSLLPTKDPIESITTTTTTKASEEIK